MSTKYVLLPAYNEEQSVETLVQKIRQVATENDWDYRIIACNDGSRDSTGALLAKLGESHPLEVITHKLNRGLGETVRDLFERAAEVSKPGDVIVRLDCDDSHEPSYIKAMVDKIAEGYDVVTASRFEPGGGQMGVSGYRAFISSGANLFMRFFFRIKGLKEYSCGYRAYTADIVKLAIRFYGNNFVQLRGLGFTCTLEKLLKFHMLGARFGEVPFVLRYDQKLSSSKMLSGVTTLGYIVMTINYHWPWGGWRRNYGRMLREQRAGVIVTPEAVDQS